MPHITVGHLVERRAGSASNAQPVVSVMEQMTNDHDDPHISSLK